MSFWCLQFLPKNERKQVNLRFHSCKVEFIRSFFERNVDLKKSFRPCLTFMGIKKYVAQKAEVEFKFPAHIFFKFFPQSYMKTGVKV